MPTDQGFTPQKVRVPIRPCALCCTVPLSLTTRDGAIPDAQKMRASIVPSRSCGPHRQNLTGASSQASLPRVFNLHLLLRTPQNSIISLLMLTTYKP